MPGCQLPGIRTPKNPFDKEGQYLSYMFIVIDQNNIIALHHSDQTGFVLRECVIQEVLRLCSHLQRNRGNSYIKVVFESAEQLSSKCQTKIITLTNLF